MLKKNIQCLTLAALVLFGVLIGSTVAYWRGQGTAASTVSMGTLDGVLITQQGKGTGVYPGDSIQASASVANAGGLDLIVRLKVDPSWQNNANGALKNEVITLNYNLGKDNGQWMDGNDGYYYYRGILRAGQTTPELYSSFTVSAKEADNEYFGRTADIKVTMECLQATANAVKMWNKTYADLGLSEPETMKAQAVTVALNKDKKFVMPGSGLFSGFGNMTPGEMREQVITISNESEETIQFFLRGEAAEQNLSNSEKELLDKLLKNYTTLLITDSTGKTLYKGPLVSASGQDAALGSLAKGKSENYTVSLLVSSEAGNEFQSLAGKIQWVFTAQGEDGKTTTSTTTTGGKLSQTGGIVPPWAILSAITTFFMVALLFVLLMIRKKRKEMEEQTSIDLNDPPNIS